jgi:hypothetical protein
VKEGEGTTAPVLADQGAPGTASAEAAKQREKEEHLFLDYVRLAALRPRFTVGFFHSSSRQRRDTPSSLRPFSLPGQAKGYDWVTVGRLVDENPALINAHPCGRWSALHQAVRANERDIVELLLSRRADVAVKNASGQTPMDPLRRSQVVVVVGVVVVFVGGSSSVVGVGGSVSCFHVAHCRTWRNPSPWWTC